jgi:hypothetical protein
MKNIININEGTLSGDVFYGSFTTVHKDKEVTVSVSNHIKDINKEYEFRIAGKCRAGFINIHDKVGTAHSVIAGYKKNTLVNVQVKGEHGHWMNVLTTKGTCWLSIDKAFLEVLTVGDIRNSHPDMADLRIWNLMNAKTWADKSYTQN